MRPPGVPLIRVFEAETMAFLDRLEDGAVERADGRSRGSRARARRCATGCCWPGSARRRRWWPRSRTTRTDLAAAAVVRSLVWTDRLVFRAAIRRLGAGEDPAEVAADLREQAQRAYASLGRGLARYLG